MGVVGYTSKVCLTLWTVHNRHTNKPTRHWILRKELPFLKPLCTWETPVFGVHLLSSHPNPQYRDLLRTRDFGTVPKDRMSHVYSWWLDWGRKTQWVLLFRWIPVLLVSRLRQRRVDIPVSLQRVVKSHPLDPSPWCVCIGTCPETDGVLDDPMVRTKVTSSRRILGLYVPERITREEKTKITPISLVIKRYNLQCYGTTWNILWLRVRGVVF